MLDRKTSFVSKYEAFWQDVVQTKNVVFSKNEVVTETENFDVANDVASFCLQHDVANDVAASFF